MKNFKKWIINEGRSISDGNITYSGFPKILNEVKDDVRLASLRFEDWMEQTYGSGWRGWYNALPVQGKRNFYDWFTTKPNLVPPKSWKNPLHPEHQHVDKDQDEPQGGSPLGPMWDLEGEGLMHGIDWIGGFFLPSVDPSTYPENSPDYQFGGTVHPGGFPYMTPKPVDE